MKTLVSGLFVIALLLFEPGRTFSQNDYAGLNGTQFKCRITEITPPDVDRMPMVFEETVSFEGGRLSSDFLKKYFPGDLQFTASIDHRRAVAFTVVQFEAKGSGTMDNRTVEIDYSGNVVGYAGLCGEIQITGNGVTEKYLVETVNP